MSNGNYTGHNLTSMEPVATGDMKKMLSPHAKEASIHISGDNKTGQYTTETTPHGELGQRKKQS